MSISLFPFFLQGSFLHTRTRPSVFEVSFWYFADVEFRNLYKSNTSDMLKWLLQFNSFNQVRLCFGIVSRIEDNGDPTSTVETPIPCDDKTSLYESKDLNLSA